MNCGGPIKDLQSFCFSINGELHCQAEPRVKSFIHPMANNNAICVGARWHLCRETHVWMCMCKHVADFK